MVLWPSERHLGDLRGRVGGGKRLGLPRCVGHVRAMLACRGPTGGSIVTDQESLCGRRSLAGLKLAMPRRVSNKDRSQVVLFAAIGENRCDPEGRQHTPKSLPNRSRSLRPRLAGRGGGRGGRGSHPAARSRHISLSDWPGLVPKLNGAARASSFFMNYYKILRSPGGLVRGNLAYLARI